MTKRPSFNTVTIRGGLLPTGLLDRIGKQDRDLEGVAPSDYHLASGERLGEAITRSWNRLLGVWERFTDRLADDEGALTGPTRQEWLLPLFQELGYGQLQAAPGFEIEAKAYPISHLWESVPVHLVGAGVDLDRRSPGVPGAATASPHGLVQEFLNRSDEYQWGIVSNGRRLRLLRDNASLTRSAYVEFDLEEMLEGEVYSDFVLLWLTCHASRLEGPAGKQLLERWREEAARQGVRAMDALRDGVERAIEALGSAAVGHPSNHQLRHRLETEDLDPQDLYRQLLRVVYRILFLLVTESRDLLLDPDADPTARQRYHRYYSVTRLRNLAETTRGSSHTDLWRQLQVVSDALESRGEPALGLLPLGGFLWAAESTEALNDIGIPNSALLDAIRALTTVKVNGVVQRVDYANLGSEELGSIYESLLELHPEVNPVAGSFDLTSAAGNERKTTGSYYTPTPLIDELLNSALDPVLDRAAKSDHPEAAILDLKVVDPAAGSGHFLIAAANRIANRLARVRAGEDEPSPEQLRTAIRDVIGHCIYAVDANPMAVELAKVALWLEATEPGKPLSFLDHHIVCGNSLLGTTPELLEDGVPDDAFKALTGDDNDHVKELRKRNRAERKKGLAALPFGDTPDELLQHAADALAEIDALDDTSLPDVEEKRKRYEALLHSTEQRRLRLAADAWVAAFVAPKTGETPAITHAVVNTALGDPERMSKDIVDLVEDLATELRFHHWHLAFPDVFTEERGGRHPQAGWFGGFDVVLGNPPWERVKLQEKEFFASSAPEIAKAPNKAARTKRIDQLREDNPRLWESFQRALHRSEAISHFLRRSGVYPLCGRGDVNTYTVFAEGMRTITGPAGRTGVIVPTGIATDDTTKHFFADLVEKKSLVSLFDFENRRKIFPGIDSRIKFCLLTLSGTEHPIDEAEFCFFALDTGDLSDRERRFTLTPEDFRLLNPNTRTCPIFRTRRDAEITKGIYKQIPVLLNEMATDGDPWQLTFLAMFHSANDAHRFVTSDELENGGAISVGPTYEKGPFRWLPLYEAKMVGLLEPRAADIVMSETAVLRPGQPRPLSPEELSDPLRWPNPRYWVREKDVNKALEEIWHSEWLLAWRDVTSPTNERTVLATAVPRTAILDSLLLLLPSIDERLHLFLLGAMTSFAFDFIARQKIGGVHIKYYLLKQLPVPRPEFAQNDCPWDHRQPIVDFVSCRLVELLCDSYQMVPLGRTYAGISHPFMRCPSRRELLRAELDAAFFHIYGLERDDVEHIMSSFEITRRKDTREHGRYRTKEIILEAYDLMSKAIDTGEPYETLLDPPPADPSLCHPMKED